MHARLSSYGRRYIAIRDVLALVNSPDNPVAVRGQDG